MSKTLDELKRNTRSSSRKMLPDADSCNYDDYLMAMKRVHHRTSTKDSMALQMQSPRDRHRKQNKNSMIDSTRYGWDDIKEASRISILASMVPDEIIYKHNDHSIRCYDAALMLVDLSGFTDFSEKYTTTEHGGPSTLTQVLNSYIGAMVQEIVMHNGDVLKFSGDAFLSMWKKTARSSMQDVVHTAIDCGLVIQKNYGSYVTNVGAELKAKVAITAGRSYFSIIGNDKSQSYFVLVGQPVLDVKLAEHRCTPGDVLTAASAWMYVNEAEYCTQPSGDGRHIKVLGVGASWKRVEKIQPNSGPLRESGFSRATSRIDEEGREGINFREFSLRPAVVAAMRGSWWPGLRRFMVSPVLRAVDNDEPMEYLTEIRRVVVVFVNIVTKPVSEDVLIGLVNSAFKCALSVTSESGGLVNKVSLFDKDMMILIVFGLRGLKHEDETQKALLCASHLKEHLTDQNILNISIGVTSGITYCGIVGHALRREYTVIGPAVNKAARIMVAYPNIVSCDKETFLRSKLDQQNFMLLEPKALKGIAKPGPIYEFSKSRWVERVGMVRPPILGRNEELRKFKLTLQNAIDEHNRSFTRFRDHKFGVALIGPKMVGKRRLVTEYLNITPDYMQTDKIMLAEGTMDQFAVFRMIFNRKFSKSGTRASRHSIEDRIKYSVDMSSATPIQIHAVNCIFGSRFPLPERFDCTQEFLGEIAVKFLVQEIFKKHYPNLWVLAIICAEYVDDGSWFVLLMLMDAKLIFIIFSFNETNFMSTEAKRCLESNMIVKVYLTGIGRCYHAALACQLLDVQAIPTDLEKVIECASNGLPGWIQDFVISLVQRGVLTTVAVPRIEAIKAGAVMPLPGLLTKMYDDYQLDVPLQRTHSYQSIYSIMSVSMRSKNESSFTINEGDTVQMAVLAKSYTFADINVDIAMDASILKTYDSLTPFEKMLLKCGSVLGDKFSRRMLMYLLQCDTPRQVAEAVAKLFKIRVLACEGGDFGRETSMVLIHPVPLQPPVETPYCGCLGINKPANCQDLPNYAFCGYIKFVHSMFRTTTYELLTETQKHDMHARALLYYQRYTRRCVSCGSGCFILFLGLHADDGLGNTKEDMNQARMEILALSAEADPPDELDSSMSYEQVLRYRTPKHSKLFQIDDEGTLINRITDSFEGKSKGQFQKQKRIRSFSSFSLARCECLSILLAVYCECIEHCRRAGEYEKLFSAYIEYANVCINVSENIPQAVRLLTEAEELVEDENLWPKRLSKNWVKDFYKAQVYSTLGMCMIVTKDLLEAKKFLMLAMKLLGKPFPTSKHWVRVRDFTSTFNQIMALYILPNMYIGIESGFASRCYDEIAKTLSRLYRVFSLNKEFANAELAAKLGLNYALRSNSNLRLLCTCYGHMIDVYRLKRKFTLCMKLERQILARCRRKRCHLDVTEAKAVCYLYTNIFLSYVQSGRKMESLDFGLSVMELMSSVPDLVTRQMLVLWMLKLLLCELKIQEMVVIMREYLYLTDYYDLSCFKEKWLLEPMYFSAAETWYYYEAIVILLDTGYCVESYGACEKFFNKKGDALLRTKTPEAARNFFVCMWLITIRIGAWERSIVWEENIRHILNMKFDNHEYSVMMVNRLVEGLLITLVNEMDNRNIKKIIVLEKLLKSTFHYMTKTHERAPMYSPRYYLMLAYYNYIKGRKFRAYNYLNKSRDLAKHNVMSVTFWCEHVRNHWNGTLNPTLVNYWTEHIEPDNLLDYRDFDPEKSKIVPYTLPLPKDLGK